MLHSRLFAAAVAVIAAGCSPVAARTGTVGAAAASNAAPPRSQGAETVVQGEWATAWHNYLSRAVPFGFAGAVLAARDGEIVLQAGYGPADRERGVPITPATVFYIGSLTKQFTAAGIMKLVDQGRLSTRDSLGALFEGVPVPKRGITVHQLLSHTAGLPRDVGDLYGSWVAKDAHVRAVLDAELASAPGAEYGYSNAAYTLLAAIIERVSGSGYERFLHEHLFRPAGMEETGYVLPGWDLARVAPGYRDDENAGTPLQRPNWTPDGPGWAIRGAGGMLSTLGDLYRWHEALQGDAVLSSAAREQLFGSHARMGENEHYGYGWVVEVTPQGRLISHNGSDGIYYAVLRRYPEGVLIGLTNQSLGTFQQVDARLSAAVAPPALPGTPAPAPVVQLSPERLERYAGTYHLPSGGSIALSVAGGRLWMESRGQEGMNAVFGLQPRLHADYAERTLRADAFMDSLVAAMREPAGPAPAGRAGLVRRMANVLQPRTAALGRLVGHEVIGTVPAREGDEEAHTPARLRFSEGSYALELLWTEGRIVGASLAPAGTPGRLPVQPRSGTELVGYHFETGRVLELRFEGGEQLSVLRLRAPEGRTVEARRAP